MKKSLTALPRLVVEGAGQCADLVYSSGFMPVDPVVFLDEKRRKTLVVPMLEYSRARAEAQSVDVLLPEDINVPRAQGRRLPAWAICLLQHRGVRHVRVGPNFPASVLVDLQRQGIRVNVEAASLYPERDVKDAGEIEKITMAQRAAVSAMRCAANVLKESSVLRSGELRWSGRVLSSDRLRAVIDTALLQRECIARDTIVAGGAQAADPHERGHGPLRARSSIVIDIFPQHKRTGYWGDITRTFCKGTPPPPLARMYQAVFKAQAMALKMIRPGVDGSDVHGRVASLLEAAGYPLTVRDGVVRGFFHGTGHGVGLEIHEAPSISRGEVVLRAGHVVTVEPGLYDPDIGGVRIEDTVVVVKGGARVLASFPRKFVVP